MRRKLLFAALIGPLLATAARAADDVRYYSENGVTYRETRRVVRRPVSDTRLESRERTVYRERLTTETRQSERVVHTPVTEYRWEAHWRGRWNPLQQPYLEYRLVPRTCYQPRTEMVRFPVTHRELIPEKQVVQIPVTNLRFVDEEQISRVAVSGPGAGDPFAAPSYVAQRQRIGGVSRLDSDPPRYGDSGWRTVGGTVRR